MNLTLAMLQHHAFDQPKLDLDGLVAIAVVLLLIFWNHILVVLRYLRQKCLATAALRRQPRRASEVGLSRVRAHIQSPLAVLAAGRLPDATRRG